MINMAAYAVLVVAFLASVVGGRLTILYAAALLIPLSQVMPNPPGFVAAPTNLILMGLALLPRLHAGKIAIIPGAPPLRGVRWFVAVATLIALAIRGLAEFDGATFLLPFAEVLRRCWYWLTPFVLFTLVYRLATEPVARRVVSICQLSVMAECLITVWERASGAGRATAHIGEPNRAGAYFAGASAFFFAWFLLSEGKRKWLYLAAWISAVMGVFNSLSRGAMLASALSCAAVLLVFLFSGRKAPGGKAIVLIVAVLVVANITLFLPQSVLDRIEFTFQGAGRDQTGETGLDSSASARLQFWAVGLELVSEQPWGHGLFTFPQYVYLKLGEVKQAHNVYVQIMAEQGIQGLIAVLFLVVGVLGITMRSYGSFRDDWGGALALGLAGWWTAHCVAHFFVNPFFSVLVIGQFWIMLACLLAVRNERAAAAEPARKPPSAQTENALARPSARARPGSARA